MGKYLSTLKSIFGEGFPVVNAEKHKDEKEVCYYNVPASFDIETSSFYNGEEKVSLMYHWQFAIKENVVTGRTWQEYQSFIDDLQEVFSLSFNLRLLVFVHNLGFEFQHMRKYFSWERMFASKAREPIYCMDSHFIEYRDSYILSGYSLSNLAENLTRHNIRKMKGDLDYSLIRSPETPLTDEEVQYCYNDVLILTAYIEEEIENNGGSIAKIPLTKTGVVRRHCRNICLRQGNFKKYMGLMKKLQIEDEAEYKHLKEAFQGGFTHANFLHTMTTIEDVASYDFTSSYPYVMVSEMFPMGKGRREKPADKVEFEYYLKKYCCLFEVQFFNLRPKVYFENPISFSRCYGYEGYQLNPSNNGRLVSAKKVGMTITEIDFDIIKRFYKWDAMKVGYMKIYKKGYLPKPLIKAILDLYKAKTELKGVPEKIVEYMVSKGMLNSCYGMCVMDIVRDEIKYDSEIHEWYLDEAKAEEQIQKENERFSRFLFYPWGVWITAYARYNLFSGIWECQEDYVYSDTDSIKILNYEKHKGYIEKYNQHVIEKLKLSAETNDIPFEDFCPCNIKGKKKMLGVWEFEGVYKKFKTLGAKRYLALTDTGELILTCAGVGKETGAKYLSSFENPFDAFKDKMVFPAEFTGKLTHTYIDDSMEGEAVDYMGKPFTYQQLSGIHLEPAEYNLDMSILYLQYLEGRFNLV